MEGNGQNNKHKNPGKRWEILQVRHRAWQLGSVGWTAAVSLAFKVMVKIELSRRHLSQGLREEQKWVMWASEEKLPQ